MGRKRRMRSSVGDLTGVCKAVEEAIEESLGVRPALMIVFALPKSVSPDGTDTHWVSNINRQDAVKLLAETIVKMQAGMN